MKTIGNGLLRSIKRSCNSRPLMPSMRMSAIRQATSRSRAFVEAATNAVVDEDGHHAGRVEGEELLDGHFGEARGVVHAVLDEDDGDAEIAAQAQHGIAQELDITALHGADDESTCRRAFAAGCGVISTQTVVGVFGHFGVWLARHISRSRTTTG